MPDTKKVIIEDTGDDFHTARFYGSIGPFASDIALKRRFNDTQRRISWSLVQGRPKSVNGCWLVEKAPNRRGSIVTYRNCMCIGCFLPDALVVRSMKKNVKQMIESIKKRVASGGIWKSEEYNNRLR